MDAHVLAQSDDLIQRSAELRTRSARARAAADEQMEDSRRLIAAAAKARAAVRYAHGREPAQRTLALSPALRRLLTSYRGFRS